MSQFLGKIVVIKTWEAPSADPVIDRRVWNNFDIPDIVYLYVYVGNDLTIFRKEPTPSWKEATALLLTATEDQTTEIFGKARGNKCCVVDQRGYSQMVPTSSGTGDSQWSDALVVKRLLNDSLLQPSRAS
jgi:hypothetical protein